jgi:hypothetical protein
MVLRTILFVLIWVGVLQFKLFRSNSREEESSAAFWERERKANFTRKQPLPVDKFIHIPLEQLPFSEPDDPEEQDIQEQLLALSKETIFNASGMTNTDIKLTYGSGNFHLISQYDQNFLLLQRLLSRWGVLLYERGDKAAAKTVLEYSVSLGCDISSCYVTLASIYEEEQDYISIKDLIESVKETNTLIKDSIIHQLEAKLP